MADILLDDTNNFIPVVSLLFEPAPTYFLGKVDSHTYFLYESQVSQTFFNHLSSKFQTLLEICLNFAWFILETFIEAQEFCNL